VLDDFPHFEYVGTDTYFRPGLWATSKVEEIWRDEFAYMYREVAGGVYNLTMHPQVIGRGHRMLLLERLIAHFQRHEGVRFATLSTVAEEFRASHVRK
jgi:peptidoglycan-N-acetylglucosamine deacetylase